jgi:hypothetical protein
VYLWETNEITLYFRALLAFMKSSPSLWFHADNVRTNSLSSNLPTCFWSYPILDIGFINNCSISCPTTNVSPTLSIPMLTNIAHNLMEFMLILLGVTGHWSISCYSYTQHYDSPRVIKDSKEFCIIIILKDCKTLHDKDMSDLNTTATTLLGGCREKSLHTVAPHILHESCMESKWLPSRH